MHEQSVLQNSIPFQNTYNFAQWEYDFVNREGSLAFAEVNGDLRIVSTLNFDINWTCFLIELPFVSLPFVTWIENANSVLRFESTFCKRLKLAEFIILETVHISLFPCPVQINLCGFSRKTLWPALASSSTMPVRFMGPCPPAWSTYRQDQSHNLATQAAQSSHYHHFK